MTQNQNQPKNKKRISATAWVYLRDNYPDDVKQMHRVDIPVNSFNTLLKKRSRRSKKPKQKKAKTNQQKYGQELGEIIDWLEENCNDQFYAKFQKGSWDDPNKVVEFFFMEETDAMAFKLMF